MFSKIKAIFLAIARNRALAIMVVTFFIIIFVIIFNISSNWQITKEFADKVQQTEKLFKTQNLIAQLERKLAEAERIKRLLAGNYEARFPAFEEQNQVIGQIGNNLQNPDSSFLSDERRASLRLLLGERSILLQQQLPFLQKQQAVPEAILEASQDKLMELNGFTEMTRRELAQSLENNIRYLRRKIDISNQVNFLLVITAIIAAIYATTLTTQDFLRQKQIEAILRSLNDEKSRLFSILGHDLRSPLSSLNAIIYILRNHRREMSDEDLDESVRQLEMASVNYTKLLEDVLTWSRLQLNKVAVDYQDLPVFDLVKETSELYSDQVQQKKIWIHNQIPGGTIIHTDRGMVQVVLRNLLSNAIKFTSEGGDIWINHRSDKEYHYIDVKDSGIGMSDAIVKTLFTNSTISMSGTHNESGTGLGLSICKEFLNKDFGFLQVESIEGKGSVFTICLPLPETRKRLQKERRKNQALLA
jgi:signal transduction histidine kinase